MGNFGQVALTIVGAVAGAYIGFYMGNPVEGALLGSQLGALAGRALFPTIVLGPQIADLNTTTSMVGAPVTVFWGTIGVSGNVMWLAPVITNHSTGKGTGTATETFSYTQSIAIGLAEATAIDGTAHPIAGILRIWENGKLVYDVRPQQSTPAPAWIPDSEYHVGDMASHLAPDGITLTNYECVLDNLGALTSDLAHWVPDLVSTALLETDQMYANRLAAAASYAETFVLYLGGEDQLPDPTIEALEGVGNVPAFRGLAYIVYPNRQLQDSQALRHPGFKFEMFTAGTLDCVAKTDYATEVLYPWAGEGIINGNNINTFQVSDWDQNLPLGVTMSNATFDTFAEAMGEGERVYGRQVPLYLGYGIPEGEGTAVAPDIDQSGGQLIARFVCDPISIDMHYSVFAPNTFYGRLVNVSPWTGGWLGNSGEMAWEAGTTYLVSTVPADDEHDLAFPPWPDPWISGSGYFGYFWFFSFDDLVIRVIRAPAPPLDPCLGLAPTVPGTPAQNPVQSVPGFVMQPDGTLISCGPWTKVVADGDIYLALSGFFPGYSAPTIYPLDPCMRDDDPRNTEEFWTAAYNAAVDAGKMPPGWTYQAGGGSVGADETVYPMVQNFAYERSYQQCVAAPGGEVTLDAIVSDICHRVGMEDYDTSDLAAVTVGGYAISNSSVAARGAIDPLRSVGFFDVVESGEVLKFVRRGKPVVATLGLDDIGVYEASGDPPPAVSITQLQDVDLPRTVRFNYIAISRDYQPGQKISPSRLTTLSVNDIDVSVAIAMTDTQALNCAAVLWADAWSSAKAAAFVVDQSWSELEPSDCIGLPVDGYTERVRIIDTTDAAVVMRKMNAVIDNDASYVSALVSPAPRAPQQTVKIYAPTALIFLDLPALREADNDAGFYVAAAQPPGGAWSGAQIYQGNAIGGGFTAVGALSRAIIAGTVLEVPNASIDAGIWDDASQLVVQLPPQQAFESLTDDQVLAGGNMLAVGVNGRWLMIQFGQAAQISPTQWKLTHLLQGRRGTEYQIGSTQIGDQAVLIDGTALLNVGLAQAQIGQILQYKAATIGTALAGVPSVAFQGGGRRLQCFSPVGVSFSQPGGPGTDITISWIRRDRLGQELLASGIGVPMSETVEKYEVDILADLGDPSITLDSTAITIDSTLISIDTIPKLLRTLTAVGLENVVYTAAMQAADLPGDQTSFSAQVFQISSVLGRGPGALAAAGAAVLMGPG